jgi:uncharacterized protein (TIGR02145 family)
MNYRIHLENNIKHAMANLCKALLCLVFLSAFTGHIWAQENPSSPDTTQGNWINYNHESNSIQPGEYYILFREVGTGCVSDTATFDIHLLEQPAAPVALAQSFCSGSVVADLVAECPDSTQLLWYASADSDTVLATNTELESGTYYAATVSTQGCESERVAVEVTVNPLLVPEVSIYTEDSLLCEGENVSFAAQVSPSEINVSEYQWFVNNQESGSNNATFTSPGLNNGDEVSCRVIVHGNCVYDSTAFSNVIIIEVIPQITFAVTDSTTYGDTSGTVVLSGLETGKSYAYHLDGNDWQNYANNISGLEEGWHEIKIREEGIGCESDTVGFAINLTDSITFDLNVLTDVSVYGGNDGSVSLSNVAGGVGNSYTLQLNDNPAVPFTAPLTIDTLSAGTYTVQVFDEADNASSIQVFTIEQPQTITFTAYVARHETMPFAEDGIITIDSIYAGQSSTFEYSIDDGETWDVIAQGGQITGLAHGIVSIQLRTGTVYSGVQSFTICQPLIFTIEYRTICGADYGTIESSGLDILKTYDYQLKYSDESESEWSVYSGEIEIAEEGAYSIRLADQVTSCLSDWKPFEIQLKLQPNSPLAEEQSFCGAAVVSDLEATTETGNQLRWYATAESDTVLAANTELESMTYYAATVSTQGCESERVAVEVTVNPMLDVSVSITVDNTEICEDDEVSFTAEISEDVTEVNYQWYLNNEPTGTNSPTFSSLTLNNGDEIYCSVFATGTCIDETPVMSDVVTIEVSPKITFEVNDLTDCGDLSGTIELTDIESGKEYEYLLYNDRESVNTEIDSIKIGNKVWMVKNLDIDDGLGGIYVYNNDESYVIENGRLYTQEAARRIANYYTGWRLPNDRDWGDLGVWHGLNLTKSVQIGFDALPCGRWIMWNSKSSGFYDKGVKAHFISNSQGPDDDIYISNTISARAGAGILVAASLRLVRDNTTQTISWHKYDGSINNIKPDSYFIQLREKNTTFVSAIDSFTIELLEQPDAPVVGIITHSTCMLATGSVELSGLPEGNWTIQPVNISGSGSSVNIPGLEAGQS